MSIESRRLEESKKDIDLMVKQFGAYYEAESAENQPRRRSYNLTVRVPVNRFDSLLRVLDQIEDKVISKNISTEDITTQYVDVQTRLQSKRTYLNRYQDMAKNASSVIELLEIEEQIQKLQEDIESAENVMRSLDDQVNYCTLRIYLFDHQSNINQTKDGFFRRAIEAVVNGWHLIDHVAITAITLWPIWLIVASVVLIVHRVRMRRQNKHRSPNKP